MDDAHGGAFDEFVVASSTRLLRVAFLLTGDRHAAEDLVQEVLEQMYMKWRRLYGPPEAYARRALVNRATNRWRARRRRPERPLDGVDPGTPDAADEVVVRDVVVAALRTLPARQRAAVVLRFLEDLPVVEVARALDCSEGTVKSHTSRGLTRLRRALADSGLAGRAVGATVLVGAPVAGRGARPGPAVHAGAPVVSLVGAAVQVAGAAGVGRAYAVGGLTECGL